MHILYNTTYWAFPEKPGFFRKKTCTLFSNFDKMYKKIPTRKKTKFYKKKYIFYFFLIFYRACNNLLHVFFSWKFARKNNNLFYIFYTIFYEIFTFRKIGGHILHKNSWKKAPFFLGEFSGIVHYLRGLWLKIVNFVKNIFAHFSGKLRNFVRGLFCQNFHNFS